jgi:hypothetical protein
LGLRTYIIGLLLQLGISASFALAQLPGDVFSNYPSNNQSSRPKRVEKVVPSAVDSKGRYDQYFEDIETFYSAFASRFQSRFWRLATEVFAYSEVEMRGNKRARPDELIKSAGLSRGRWFWENSVGDIVSRLESHPWVRSVQPQLRFYPLRLVLNVEEKEPWITAEFNNGVWVVDRSGELICPLSGIEDIDLLDQVSDLVLLRGLKHDETAGLRSYFGSENAKYLHAVRSLRFIFDSANLPYSIAVASLKADGSLVLSPVSAEKPEFRLKATSLEDTRESLENLSLILADLSKRGEKTKLIDLRFSGRAIVK